MNDIHAAAEKLVKELTRCALTVSFAESCTGGFVTKLITDVSGASAVLPGGVCSYSNDVKNRVLNVNADDLRSFGAVSEPVACQMAQGIKALMRSDFGAGITGIAGPRSDDTKKPVGLVYIAVASPDGSVSCREHHFNGTRDEIRQATALAALEAVFESLKNTGR